MLPFCALKKRHQSPEDNTHEARGKRQEAKTAKKKLAASAAPKKLPPFFAKAQELLKDPDVRPEIFNKERFAAARRGEARRAAARLGWATQSRAGQVRQHSGPAPAKKTLLRIRGPLGALA